MFPRSWFPPTYFPPSYFPEVGGAPPTPPPTIVAPQTPVFMFDMQEGLRTRGPTLPFPDHTFPDRGVYPTVPVTVQAKAPGGARVVMSEGDPGTSIIAVEEEATLPVTLVESVNVVRTHPPGRVVGSKVPGGSRTVNTDGSIKPVGEN